MLGWRLCELECGNDRFIIPQDVLEGMWKDEGGGVSEGNVDWEETGGWGKEIHGRHGIGVVVWWDVRRYYV